MLLERRKARYRVGGDAVRSDGERACWIVFDLLIGYPGVMFWMSERVLVYCLSAF